MEGLNCLLKRAKEEGYIMGFKLSRRGGKGKEASPYELPINQCPVAIQWRKESTRVVKGAPRLGAAQRHPLAPRFTKAPLRRARRDAVA
ncbi:hypothetical protein CK203_028208 [Vitis vinifera]|uniref:Uncharacterized protein n=1 Tax=Vitis vinifera TaxID=29760 RepID=A0A438IB00_VITVI|nr:hypothetical protein CK203_028208 [Vitis vinifera]